MISELSHDFDERINLVYGLYKLFLEIDFNGDEHMQWEEFTQFIIDTVMGENNEKLENEEEEDQIHTGKDLSEKQLLKYKRYNVSTLVEDKSLHDTEIIDSLYSSKIDILFVVEYKTKTIKLYNAKIGKPEVVFNLDNFLKTEALPASKASKSSKSTSKSKPKKKAKLVEEKQNQAFSILSICISNGNLVDPLLS